MDKCPLCKEFLYSSIRHQCNPTWITQIVDGYNQTPSEDWEIDEYSKQIVYAKSASDAAEKCISESDWKTDSATAWRVIVCLSADVEERDVKEGHFETTEWMPKDKYSIYDVIVEADPVFYSKLVKRRENPT